MKQYDDPEVKITYFDKDVYCDGLFGNSSYVPVGGDDYSGDVQG